MYLPSIHYYREGFKAQPRYTPIHNRPTVNFFVTTLDTNTKNHNNCLFQQIIMIIVFWNQYNSLCCYWHYLFFLHTSVTIIFTVKMIITRNTIRSLIFYCFLRIQQATIFAERHIYLTISVPYPIATVFEGSVFCVFFHLFI